MSEPEKKTRSEYKSEPWSGPWILVRVLFYGMILLLLLGIYFVGDFIGPNHEALSAELLLPFTEEVAYPSCCWYDCLCL